MIPLPLKIRQRVEVAPTRGGTAAYEPLPLDGEAHA